MDEIERYARLMGMKRTEVLEVVPGDDGHAVRTHDGQWTLVRDSGVTTPIDDAYAEMLRGFHGEPEPEAGQAFTVVRGVNGVVKAHDGAPPAAKRRGRA